MEVEEREDDGKVFKYMMERRYNSEERVKCFKEGENIGKCEYLYKIRWFNEYRNIEITCFFLGG